MSTTIAANTENGKNHKITFNASDADVLKTCQLASCERDGDATATELWQPVPGGGVALRRAKLSLCPSCKSNAEQLTNTLRELIGVLHRESLPL